MCGNYKITKIGIKKRKLFKKSNNGIKYYWSLVTSTIRKKIWFILIRNAKFITLKKFNNIIKIKGLIYHLKLKG